MLALKGYGDGEVEVGEQADGGPAVPGRPADDLPGVQAGGLLAELVIFFYSPSGGGDGDQLGQRDVAASAAGQNLTSYQG